MIKFSTENQRVLAIFDNMRDRHVEQLGVSWTMRYNCVGQYSLWSFERLGVARYGMVHSDGSIAPPLDRKPETKGNGRKALDQIAFLADELRVVLTLSAVPALVDYYSAAGWQVWPDTSTKPDWALPNPCKSMVRHPQAVTASQARRALARYSGVEA